MSTKNFDTQHDFTDTSALKEGRHVCGAYFHPARSLNNIAEYALRMVSLGRKNALLFGSDHGGERGSLLYSLIGTCKLNGVVPECYLRHVLDAIADWSVNRISELQPRCIILPAE